MAKLDQVTLNTALSLLNPFSTKKQLKQVASIYNCCGDKLAFELNTEQIPYLSIRIGCVGGDSFYHSSSEEGTSVETILEILNRIYYYVGYFTYKDGFIYLKLNKSYQDLFPCTELEFEIYED